VTLTVRSGPWQPAEVEAFLATATIPVRLASNGRTYPLVQSLWFRYEGGSLWCCTRADSVLVRRLTRDRHCAFEVSADLPPYRGVRGRGKATVLTEGADATLPALLERYLGGTESPLATWLLSRLDEEVVIRIDDLVVTSWDYSARMARTQD
jgi:nitroimidazol reductase NimA-like FMN-containing flavoprotein (pyridoxamine 5'-phosphate oxidase superfamily)